MEKVKLISPHKMFIGLFVPNFIAKNPNLSHLSKLCYGKLLYYAGESCHCSPTQKILSEELCVSVRSIERALQELVSAKFIHIEHPTGSSRLDHAPNTYYFLKPKEVI